MALAFDLIAHPERIHPAYGIYAIFWAIGAVLSVLTILAVRGRWKRLYFLFVFTPPWVILTVTLTILDARDVFKVQNLVRRGDYTTVEGCLTSFHPGSPYGSKSVDGNERWSLARHDFDYGQGEARPGYHLVEARGGLVHRNSQLRVSFVTSPYFRRNEIVRLQVIGDTCPSAPDNSGY
jgi:hypothetical protein